MSVSIYATLWALQFPKFGQYYLDCDWVTVVAQGVPDHVGGEGADPYESFLPSLSTSVAGGLRAVVFVEPGAPKGTSRCAQEYEAPLLVLSGAEYASASFTALHARLCDALRAGRPRLVAEALQADSRRRLLFEDGSVVDVGSRPGREN
jgi:hypothetical protein